MPLSHLPFDRLAAALSRVPLDVAVIGRALSRPAQITAALGLRTPPANAAALAAVNPSLAAVLKHIAATPERAASPLLSYRPPSAGDR